MAAFPLFADGSDSIDRGAGLFFVPFLVVTLCASFYIAWILGKRILRIDGYDRKPPVLSWIGSTGLFIFFGLGAIGSAAAILVILIYVYLLN